MAIFSRSQPVLQYFRLSLKAAAHRHAPTASPSRVSQVDWLPDEVIRERTERSERENQTPKRRSGVVRVLRALHRLADGVDAFVVEQVPDDDHVAVGGHLVGRLVVADAAAVKEGGIV